MKAIIFMKLNRKFHTKYRRYKIIFVFILIVTACDWFNPRQPGQPWEEESEWQVPISPSIVILNLRQAFKDRNIDNYSTCLSSDFMFYGDPADSPFVPPGSFNEWDINVEIDIATRIFNTFSKKTELYFVDSLKDSTGTDAMFYEFYNMDLETPDSSVIAAGIAQFHLGLDSTNLWFITEWRDFRIDSVYFDWGILKATLR